MSGIEELEDMFLSDVADVTSPLVESGGGAGGRLDNRAADIHNFLRVRINCPAYLHGSIVALTSIAALRMHAIARGAAQGARSSRGQTLFACRIVSGVRHSLRTRNFHQSPIAYRTPESPADVGAEEKRGVENHDVNVRSESDVTRPKNADTVDKSPDSTEQPSVPRARADNGFAATRRAARNKRHREVPPLLLPEWFWDQNVKCFEEEPSNGWRIVSKRRLVIKGMPAGQDEELIENQISHFDAYLQQFRLKTGGYATSEEMIEEVMRQTDKNDSDTFGNDSFVAATTIESIAVNDSEIVHDRSETKFPVVSKSDGSVPNNKSNEDSDLEQPSQYPRKGLDRDLKVEIEEREPESYSEDPYHLEKSIFVEVRTSILAGLTLCPPPNIEMKDVVRPDLLLQCPRDDGTSFLNEIVARVASDVGADIIRLDSEDIAQIIGGYLGENIAWTRCDTSLLGYETHRISGKLESFEKDESYDDVAEEGFDDPDEEDTTSAATSFSHQLPSFLSSLKKMPMVFVQQARVGGPGNHAPAMQDLLKLPDDTSNQVTNPTNSGDRWRDFKLAAAIDAILDSSEAKRARVTTTRGKTSGGESVSNPKRLIIQINEYKELSKTPQGSKILAKLREVAKRRWHEGNSIMIVGATAAEDPVPANSRSSITRLQSDVVFGDHRTIFVAPQQDHIPSTDRAFTDDEKARVKQINIRHIQDMVQKLLGNQVDPLKFGLTDMSGLASLAVPTSPGPPTAFDLENEFSGSVMGFARVHRIASTLVGIYNSPPYKIDRLLRDGRIFDAVALRKAMSLLYDADNAKFDWARQGRKVEIGTSYMSDNEGQYKPVPDATISEKAKMNKEEGYEVMGPLKTSGKKLLDKLKKTCNSHEIKLLGGVIDPSDIHTTFADVRAPSQIVEALKTLTSLSLIRPESFSYGVLATDKIPGVLLYGPPGTGKTLLAKAVAKESGATVLEVSASEINDMYVGEGEKNVKAVFTLAKKLSPCVVFIDEADALFSARGDVNKRTSHRELINQFLREWDGMNDLSAFIMVATNRPFDLDEAVLRRLPRRLLVDLPLEKDREGILKIHLKNETLDESISLEALAKDTPFYSGSDLKNLSVAAALACVREENEEAKNYHGDEQYIFPTRRILTKKHFDKAMEEISASISEDMSTLIAIRKFDERYGDRKGRRKKGAGLGFGGTTVPEGDSEAGRVRKWETLN